MILRYFFFFLSDQLDNPQFIKILNYSLACNWHVRSLFYPNFYSLYEKFFQRSILSRKFFLALFLKGTYISLGEKKQKNYETLFCTYNTHLPLCVSSRRTPKWKKKWIFLITEKHNFVLRFLGLSRIGDDG